MAEHPNLSNMPDVMKRAQEVQKRMQEVQAKVAAMEIKGEAGAGLVVVILRGTYEVKQVTLDPEILKEGKQVMEDLIRSAFNDAKRKVEEILKLEMSKLSRDFGFPGTEDTGSSSGTTTT
jgi:hypothetical protein